MTKMLQKVPKQYIAQTRFLFHCHIKIKIPIEYGEQVLNKCFDIYDSIDQLYNSYQAGSYFDLINKNSGKWVDVDTHCIEILRAILHICELTNGAYDITCMPLLKLWGFYDSNKKKEVPTLSEIENCLQFIDHRKLSINDKQVMIGSNQEIITGSFIKAFATDEVKKFLISQGITDAIINAGGSTIVVLNDDSHNHWTINIPDPFSPGNFDKSISISNQCFSLSGRNNSNIVIDGKSYGHILNSKSGFPASTVQVGTLTDSAFIGDIISTALFSLEENEVEIFVKKLQKEITFSAFRIEENKTKYSTNAFDTLL